MSSIVQRAAWRAARRPFTRYASTYRKSSSEHMEEIGRDSSFNPMIDINTDPEPLEHYEYAPPVSRQYLTPYGWNDMAMRRNFEDPLPEHDELHSMWGPDIPPPGVSSRMALTHFLLAVGAFTGIFFSIKSFLTPEPHFIRRTYPHDGLVTELGGLTENKARIEEESED
ncbi:hypothetical protein BDP27DRAFT_1417284 [Rhodocollybia butyracea]|uniref:Uncharacterized protein n=1 Tax=Rhodocollybia butyracea TaxID=206335 RepID=A0A9P5Q2J1_9AGAR|nr:hypothetical protein BDP27DRAFT_1417284 [Rhodocollybia butyracea]